MAKVMEKPVNKRPPSLGSMIDSLWQLREEKRAAEAVVKGIETKIAAQETELMEFMDKEGVVKSTGAKATASLGSATVFNIADYDEFTKYVKKTGYFHLFQRRVSDTAAREILEMKGKVPGLEPYTRRRLNLTTVKG